MNDRTVPCIGGGPLHGQVVPMMGARLVQPEFVPAKKRPCDDTTMIFDEFGFVRWGDDDCNPTFLHHIYEYRRAAIPGEYVAEYVGVRP